MPKYFCLYWRVESSACTLPSNNGLISVSLLEIRTEIQSVLAKFRCSVTWRAACHCPADPMNQWRVALSALCLSHLRVSALCWWLVSNNERMQWNVCWFGKKCSCDISKWLDFVWSYKFNWRVHVWTKESDDRKGFLVFYMKWRWDSDGRWEKSKPHI